MPKRNGHLKLDPRNARKHPNRNKEMIRASLEEVGAFRSIAVDGQDIIRAGNGVYEQAQKLGLKVRVVDAKPNELIAVRRPDLKGKKAIRAALLDNRSSETSEWDTDVLSEIAANERKLLAGLFDDTELRELLGSEGAQGETVDAGELIDRAAELQKKWQVKRGDIWEIPSKSVAGKVHRVMCGDSTSSEDVARLMQEEKADITETDPPYGVDYH